MCQCNIKFSMVSLIKHPMCIATASVITGRNNGVGQEKSNNVSQRKFPDNRAVYIKESAKRRAPAPDLVDFYPAVVSLFSLAMSAVSTQPGAHFLADPLISSRYVLTVEISQCCTGTDSRVRVCVI